MHQSENPQQESTVINLIVENFQNKIKNRAVKSEVEQN